MGTPSPAVKPTNLKFGAMLIAVALLAFTAGMTLQPTPPFVLVLGGLCSIGWVLAVWNWVQVDELKDDLSRRRAHRWEEIERNRQMGEARRRRMAEPKSAGIAA
jgi:hypothetical protein